MKPDEIKEFEVKLEELRKLIEAETLALSSEKDPKFRQAKKNFEMLEQIVNSIERQYLQLCKLEGLKKLADIESVDEILSDWDDLFPDLDDFFPDWDEI